MIYKILFRRVLEINFCLFGTHTILPWLPGLETRPFVGSSWTVQRIWRSRTLFACCAAC